jgi:hypothetical protein
VEFTSDARLPKENEWASCGTRQWWQVDARVVDRDGRHIRFRQKRIRTKEQALAVAAKARTQSFEGTFLGGRRLPRHTVAELWTSQAPAAAILTIQSSFQRSLP